MLSSFLPVQYDFSDTLFPNNITSGVFRSLGLVVSGFRNLEDINVGMK